ncbi:SrfA family protein [Pseudomonas sp. F1_0610]|uniref:SrfA family protein n=1 Tax=Pseudomonas sp. F1_0610 TaxID=3114284 RepID=UPI0039C200D2
MTDSTINGLGGALLRSGRSGDYAALGEVGQPVYRVALQLREAIKRKLGATPEDASFNYADHLAVPQSDQLADRIDWYSSLPGDVIPWTSATEEERESAREQLRSFEEKLNAYGAELTAHLAKKAEQRSSSPNSLDQQVFIKLLTKVLHTPTADYVYLVNGRPVLTFWGFTLPNAKLPTDPLLPLMAIAKPVIAAPIVEAAPEPVIEEPAPAKRPWWRFWWWLLPLLLLLLLLWLLFGLRSCDPKLATDLGIPNLLGDTPEKVEDPKLPELEIPKIQLPDGRWVPAKSMAAQGLEGALPPVPEGQAPVDAEQPSTDPAQPPELPQDPQATPSEQPENPQQPPAIEAPKAEQNPDAQQQPTPPQLPEGAQPPATAQGNDLQIPPEAAQNGQADFLNGKWKAGAGIQDKETGKPLRLEYNFDKGKGQVTVERADGMRCTGDVNAQMKSGSLSIDSQGQAKCADGSSYDMPAITCAPGAKSAADCTGNYGNTRFPMSMRNTQ